MTHHNVSLLAALLCGFFSPSIFAQDTTWDLEVEESQWSYNIQTGIEREPVYTGSDVYVTEPELNIEAVYHANSGHEYFLSLGELGVNWQLSEKSVLSTVLEYEFGRDNSEDSALANFPEVEDTVEAQAIFRRLIGPIAVGAGLQYDILNRGKGLVGFAGVAYHAQLSSKAKFQTQFDVSFADAEHMRTEVGVSPTVAALSGFNSYSPDSGYKGVSLQVQLDYEFSERWSLLSSISVEHYGSIMSDSPLIDLEGSNTTSEASFGIKYSF